MTRDTFFDAPKSSRERVIPGNVGLQTDHSRAVKILSRPPSLTLGTTYGGLGWARLCRRRWPHCLPNQDNRRTVCSSDLSIQQFRGGTTLPQVQPCAIVTAFRAVLFLGLTMSFILQPWQLLFVILAGWVNEQQQQVIDYLRTENQVLNRDRGPSHDGTPPTPPGIRVRTTAIRLVKLWVQVPGAAVNPARSGTLG